MMVRFRTDASAIHVHYKSKKRNLAMPHMPATGVSGVDLCARDTDGIWKWVQVAKPASQEVKAEEVSGLAPGEREYAAYLPLYNGLEFLSQVHTACEASIPPTTTRHFRKHSKHCRATVLKICTRSLAITSMAMIRKGPPTARTPTI